jgi:uncharacterized protein (DUF1330 family)
MSFYVVAQIAIRDREEYDKYVDDFRKLFGHYRGEVLAVDESPLLLEGEWPWTRTAVLRFHDQQEALRWYHSEEYQAAAQHRYAGATTNLVLVKGLS